MMIKLKATHESKGMVMKPNHWSCTLVQEMPFTQGEWLSGKIL